MAKSICIYFLEILSFNEVIDTYSTDEVNLSKRSDQLIIKTSSVNLTRYFLLSEVFAPS